jgi:hypothetical protein
MLHKHTHIHLFQATQTSVEPTYYLKIIWLLFSLSVKGQYCHLFVPVVELV